MTLSKLIPLSLICLIVGGIIGYLLIRSQNHLELISPLFQFYESTSPKKQIVGFLPYWLLDDAQSDYSDTITTLTYFGLTLNGDGTIQKKVNRQESEPGWHALSSGKADNMLRAAKLAGQRLSLLIFMSDETDIATLISNPESHADNLINQITPLMTQFGFSDLNLDIESVANASEAARLQFTRFLQAIDRGLAASGSATLTVDITASDAIKQKLIKVPDLVNTADSVVIMAYDFHYRGSQVTGPVAPLLGGGNRYEYDVDTALREALKVLYADQILLGLPTYGYEWETLVASSSAAIIPGSGLTATSKRVATLLSNCTNCQVETDPLGIENLLTYYDTQTGSYHQIYYPTQEGTSKKIQLATRQNLGGVAIWALGYEDDTILEPLKLYRTLISP